MYIGFSKEKKNEPTHEGQVSVSAVRGFYLALTLETHKVYTTESDLMR